MRIGGWTKSPMAEIRIKQVPQVSRKVKNTKLIQTLIKQIIIYTDIGCWCRVRALQDPSFIQGMFLSYVGFSVSLSCNMFIYTYVYKKLQKSQIPKANPTYKNICNLSGPDSHRNACGQWACSQTAS